MLAGIAERLLALAHMRLMRLRARPRQSSLERHAGYLSFAASSWTFPQYESVENISPLTAETQFRRKFERWTKDSNLEVQRGGYRSAGLPLYRE